MTTSTNPTDKPIVGREYYHRNGVIPDMVVLYVGEKLVLFREVSSTREVALTIESFVSQYKLLPVIRKTYQNVFRDNCGSITYTPMGAADPVGRLVRTFEDENKLVSIELESYL